MIKQFIFMIAFLALFIRSENLKFFLLKEECWEKLKTFQITVPCIVSTLVQLLNIMNLSVVFLYRVPQIKKLMANKSAVGISYQALIFELTSLLCTLTYYYTQGYSILAYGENFINFFQLTIVFTLVYKYQGMSTRQYQIGLLYISVFFGVMIANLFSIQIAKFCLSLAVISFVISKLTQAFEIFKTKYSGNLSLITLIISPLGIGSRLFTAFIDLRDDTFLLVY